MSETGAFNQTDAGVLDLSRLQPWLRQHVQGISGPLEARRLEGGQSNPTFELRTPERSYVLRRKPGGKLLPSAHAVEREYRVIAALHPTGFPVPRPFALCEDPEVIGAAFYVMEKVEGRIFWDGRLPELSRADRGAVYRAEIETLARLHSLDPLSLGLADFGRAGNYFARQLDRWSKQYRASETHRVAAIDRLIAWLPSRLPAEGATAVVHGDYRLDNVILHPEAPRVAAVLDWELSTLGDPLADFSYFLLQWIMPPEQRGGLAGADLQALGVPTLNEAVTLYEACSGRPIGGLDWLFSYNLFRLAAICQGIGGRVRDGTAASPEAAAMAARVEPLSEAAWEFARKAGA